jgi:tetratricopeptide (TPR) repeat protein
VVSALKLENPGITHLPGQKERNRLAVDRLNKSTPMLSPAHPRSASRCRSQNPSPWWCRKHSQTDSSSPRAPHLGVGYEGTGKLPEAIAEYQKAVELSNGDQGVRASIAHAFAAIGNKADAEKILRDLELKSKNSYVSTHVLATIYASLGEKDKAFQYLEKSYEARSLDVSWQLKSDLRIDNLRSDPRFKDLARRVGLPQ